MIPFSLILSRLFGGFFRVLWIHCLLLLLSILYDYFFGSGCRSSVEEEFFYGDIRSARMLQMFLFWLPLGVLFCPLLLSYEPYVGRISRFVQLISDLIVSIFCVVFLITFYHILLLMVLSEQARNLLDLELLPKCIPGFLGMYPTDFFNSIVTELRGILSAFQGSPMMRSMFPPIIIGLHTLLLISQIPWKKMSHYKTYNGVMLLFLCGGIYYFLINP